MAGWWAALALAAAGVFAISGAFRYRSGRHPELGRHRDTTGLWTWQRNIIFAAGPLGVMLIGAALLAAMGTNAPLVASAVVTSVTLAALVSSIVFTYRPPTWLLPREERLHGRPKWDDSVSAPTARDEAPTIVTALRRGLVTSLFVGGGVLFVERYLPGDRSALVAADYLFLAGCFVAATLVWWALIALSRR
jgi:hypothetical protein